jgi:hypothetical protein
VACEESEGATRRLVGGVEALYTGVYDGLDLCASAVGVRRGI